MAESQQPSPMPNMLILIIKATAHSVAMPRGVRLVNSLRPSGDAIAPFLS
jgi:hypothetical protein